MKARYSPSEGWGAALNTLSGAHRLLRAAEWISKEGRVRGLMGDVLPSSCLLKQASKPISPGTSFWRIHPHSNPISRHLERQADPTRSSLGHEEARFPVPQPHGFSKGSSYCWFRFPVSPLPDTTPPGTRAPKTQRLWSG